MWGGKKIKYWWKEPLIFPESLSGALPCSLNPHAQSVWKIAAGLETVIRPESEDGETSLWAPHCAPAAVLQLSSAVCHGCLLMGVFFGLGFLFWLLILFWFIFFVVFVFLKSFLFFFMCVWGIYGPNLQWISIFHRLKSVPLSDTPLPLVLFSHKGHNSQTHGIFWGSSSCRIFASGFGNI